MSNQREEVLAFTKGTRSFHNHLLHFMVFFIITGLPIFSPSFSFLASLFAIPYDFLGSVNPGQALATTGLTDNERLAFGLQAARVIHRVIALFFVIMAIPFVVVQLKEVRRWIIWPEDRWSFAALIDGVKALITEYVFLKPARIGQFNVGQKLLTWVMIFAVPSITVSGFVLMFRDQFSPGAQEFFRFVHAASFVIIGVMLLLHIYLATSPLNRAAFHAMFGDGALPLDHVQEHHPIWYEKLKGTAESDGEPSGQP
ncbi:MAG: cytochrome b/b6 domain-containing protein [Syntrophobacteraceae bacterium]